MKKEYVIYAIMLILLVISIKGQYTTDNIFKKLDYNSDSGEAIFTLYNPYGDYPVEKLKISYNIISGGISHYDILIEDNCSRYVNNSYWAYTEECKSSKNGTICLDVKDKYIKDEHNIYWDCWKDTDYILAGEHRYNLKADLIMSDGGYELDWIPELDTGFETFKQSKWAWWNSSFKKCRNITISGANSQLTDYPVYINLDNTTDMKADGSDIRFVNASCGNNGTILKYEIENITTNNVDAWVKIPTLPTSNKIISVYYNNSAAVDAQDVVNVWDSDYKAVYHFDSDAIDSTSNNYDGTDSVTYSSSNGLIGVHSAYSSASSNYIDLNIAEGNISTSYTANIWIYKSDWNVDAREVIISDNDGSNEYSVAMQINNDNPDDLNLWSSDGTVSGVTNIPIPEAGWHFISIIRNGSQRDLYIDGVFNNTYSKSTSHTTDYHLGRNGLLSSSYRYFNGKMDESRFSSTVRNAEWINYTYQSIANHNSFITVGDVENLQNIAPVIDDKCGNFSDYHNIDYSCISNASDADGDPLTWYINDSRMNISSMDTIASLYWNSDIGDYNMQPCWHFEYWVEDDNGGNTSDTIKVCIDNTAPSISTISDLEVYVNNSGNSGDISWSDNEDDTADIYANCSTIDTISVNNATNIFSYNTTIYNETAVFSCILNITDSLNWSDSNHFNISFIYSPPEPEETGLTYMACDISDTPHVIAIVGFSFMIVFLSLTAYFVPIPLYGIFIGFITAFYSWHVAYCFMFAVYIFLILGVGNILYSMYKIFD